MNLRVITAATVEPVTLEQALQHLRLEAGADDMVVTWLIKAARDAAEQFCNRTIAETTFELRVSDFDAVLPLPANAVTSVKYLDEAGDEQTLDDAVYEFSDDPGEGYIRLKLDQEWPTILDQVDAVRIRFTAGWAPADVPGSVFAAILLTLGHLYENREDVGAAQTFAIPMGSQYLLQPYRVGMGV